MFDNKGTNMTGGFGTQAPGMPAVLQPQKPGAFGKDGWAWKVLGIVGDGLQAAGGGQGTYMPAMLDLQERADQERKFQQQLAAKAQAERENFLFEQDWRRKNPNPTATMQNFNMYQGMTPEQRKAFERFNTITKPQIITGWDGRQYEVTPQTNAEPPEVSDEDWATGEVVGGPTPPASGGFRR